MQKCAGKEEIILPSARDLANAIKNLPALRNRSTSSRFQRHPAREESC